MATDLEDLDVTIVEDGDEEEINADRKLSEVKDIKKQAHAQLAIKHLAGWSAVKMFERYVPEVVMQRIIREVVNSKKPTLVKKSSMRSIRDRELEQYQHSHFSSKIRRKSLRLKESIDLQHRPNVGTNRGDSGKVTVEDNCTVVLADISGFTKLAEKLAKRPDGSGTEILSSKLNIYFGRMIDMIYAGGGDVIKFAGDALLVVWRESSDLKRDNNSNRANKVQKKNNSHVNNTKFHNHSGSHNSDVRSSASSFDATNNAKNFSPKRTGRRKRSSVHVAMTRRGSFMNSLNVVQEDVNIRDASGSEDWRAQMKNFKNTLDDKKIQYNFIRDRALTSMSDRYSAVSGRSSRDSSFSSMSGNSFDGNYRSSNESSSNYSSSNLIDKKMKVKNPIVRDVGPEVTDFIAMVRDELEHGKLSPQQYVKVVKQRYDLYFKGELHGMGDAVSAIRREEEEVKLKRKQSNDRDKNPATSKLKELVSSMMLGVEIRNRRGKFFKYYSNCFVGEEAAIWLLTEKHCGELKEALAIGNMMLTTGLIVQLTGKRNNLSSFESNRNFYRFNNIDNEHLVLEKQVAKYDTSKSINVKKQHKLESNEINNRMNRTATVGRFLKMRSELRSNNISDTTKSSSAKFSRTVLKSSLPKSLAHGKIKNDSNNLEKKGVNSKKNKNKKVSRFRHSVNMMNASPQILKGLSGNNRRSCFSTTPEWVVGGNKLGYNMSNSEPVSSNASKSWAGSKFAKEGGLLQKCSDSTFAAVHTCLQMVRLLDKFEGLRLHIGIGVGKTLFMHVGGVLDRWEFVVAGESLVQMSRAEEEAEAGDLCVSGEVWERVGKYCFGHPTLDSIKRGSNSLGKIDECTAVHVIVGTNAVPVKQSCKRRWQSWQEERHYKIPNGLDLNLPLTLANRLLNYVPGSIRDLLTKLHLEAFETSSYNGNTTVVKYDKSRLFEFRTVSVLFINLPGIDYSKNESDILNVLQSSLVIMQEEIYLLEGSVRQFIMDDKGTTLIGVFGLYPAHDNDPFLSIKCALSIVKSLEENGIQAKVGITTGTVFAAEVGNDRRCEYAVIGDVVNMSARLMGATSKINKKLYEKISILCDQATYKATATKFRFMRLKPITVKGKKEPLNVYSPLCIRSQRSYGRSSKTPFVSREKELELLHSLIEPTISRGSGERVVTIKGHAGVGKSRLVNEFIATCNQFLAGNVKVFRVIADTLEVQRPYGALQSFLVSIINHFDNMGFCLLSEDTQSPWDLKGELKHLVPFMLKKRRCLDEIILSRDACGPTKTSIDGNAEGAIDFNSENTQPFTDDEKLHFLMCLVELYIITTSATMIVLYISHADHCDVSTINFLQKVVLNNPTNRWPFLIINTIRERVDFKSVTSVSSGGLSLGKRMLNKRDEKYQFFEDFSCQKGIIHIDLPLFDKATTKEFIISYLNGSIPTGLSSKIYNRTGGNPLYIEEVVESLVSSATLIKEDGGFKFNEVVVEDSTFSVPLPDTMKSIYQEIIDHLDSDSLWILTIASVLGVGSDTFSAGDIKYVYRETRKQVVDRSDSGVTDEKGSLEHNNIRDQNVSVRGENIVAEVISNLAYKNLIVDVTDKVNHFNVPSTFYSFCRWELQEVMYGKASFTARRKIHAAIAAYYLSGRDLNFARYRINSGYATLRAGRRSQSTVAKLSFSESKLDQYGKAHNFSIIGAHFERALDYKNAILYLIKALEIYKRLYRYVNVIETSKEILYIVNSIDYKEKVNAKIYEKGFGGENAEAERRSMVRLRRELGEIYLKIGRVSDAYPLLNKALTMCDINPSTFNNISKSNAITQFEKLLKAWNEMTEESNLPEKNASFYLLFESGLSFLSLARHYILIDSPNIGVSMVLKAVELSLIPKGPSALLARSFGVASHYLAFYLGNKKIAYKYIEAAVRVSKKVYDPPSTSLINRYHCQLSLCSAGADLGDTVNTAEESAIVSLGLGDNAAYLASKRLQGDCLYFGGKISEALSCFEDALSQITDIKTFEHVWNEIGRARCLFFMIGRNIDFGESIGVCNEFLVSFSSKAIKLLAGNRLVCVDALSLLQLYRSPRDVRLISRKRIDSVFDRIFKIDSYNSGVAYCQVIELCLGIYEAMLMSNYRQNINHADTNETERTKLAYMRLQFLFGVGFLLPDAEKYLSKVYPLAWTQKILPDKIYIYLKRLSEATKVYTVLTSCYKRLSGVFHALSGRLTKASVKFEQAIDFGTSNGLKLEATLATYMQLRYVTNTAQKEQVASQLIECSYQFNNLGATRYGKAAQLEAQVQHRLPLFRKLLGNSTVWLEFQGVSTTDALTDKIREAITNRA